MNVEDAEKNMNSFSCMPESEVANNNKNDDDDDDDEQQTVVNLSLTK